ncbi:MAG: maltose alpha-D-glucosyltransferase [Acidimicrobiia bacterium]
MSTWYEDAVIYELHVRAFADSNGDGIGDFVGLTQNLDYLEDLGVTAIWLLPFYPSPLRDEGYDISDYRGINPAYGTLRQFRRFLDEAHKRNLRVITEIVLNHTSDQHAWFQRARRAPAGSRYRDWYVWSDDPNKYRDARIIFRDFEQSNWTWDPTAGQYYWHRFYSTQPDLNYDNPEVRREMLRTVEYWLDLGVDGLRLDAVPYLIEREGTSCENLPETHDYLKELRRHVDSRFDDRMLLAEANQWPEDAIAYFGDADECHMAFHFPLMPRLFMGLRMEDRFPIIDILRQTPPIPDKTQWAVFLRNHDELTLEMVTDEERDYMYRTYANDPAMRINLGIRRRLAPLLHSNRQKMELMHGLLCSLPGTPVLYYGDEIGMGDTVYLGDRDGVRTPMQWSADRNAGFSTANPQRLFLPVIIDPEYNYETVNVAAQLDNPESLLWWVRRLIALRKRYPVFGHGSIELLSPDNHRVLAFLRRDGGAGSERPTQQVLVVANLSRHSQYVELDLSEFRGMHPVELFGQTTFPTIGDLPYLLTLGPHAFYWLALEPAPVDPATAEHPVLPALDAPGPWDSLFTREQRARVDAILPRVLRGRRWFGAKGRRVTSARISDVAEIPLPFLWTEDEDLPPPNPARLTFVRVEYLDGEPDTYVLPVAFVPGAAGARLIEDHPSSALALVQPATGEAGVLVDAHWLPGYGRALLSTLARRRRIRTEVGSVAGVPGTSAARALADAASRDLPMHVLRGEQSNTSLVFDEEYILKTMRRLEPGENPEVEIGRALTERARFEHSPALAGALEYRTAPSSTSVTTLAVLNTFVPNESDAYSWFAEALSRYFEEALSHPADEVDPVRPSFRTRVLDLVDREVPAVFEEMTGGILPPTELLGERVGELHVALASIDDPAFAPEPMNALALRSAYQSMRNTAQQTLRALRRRTDSMPDSTAADSAFVLAHADEVLARLADVMRAPGGQRIRVHGDLHLGQVLYTGRDFVILDFEGEPARPLGERRLKRSPFRDIAGMLRSFDYAANAAISEAVARGTVRSEARAHELLAGRAAQWVAWVSAAFLRGYFAALEGRGLLPGDRTARRIQLDAHLLDKAFYEVRYELDHRPDWVGIPIRGIAALLAGYPDGWDAEHAVP